MSEEKRILDSLLSAPKLKGLYSGPRHILHQSVMETSLVVYV